MKKIAGLASLTAWDRQKRHGTVKNGKTINETWPDRLSLKLDFQNCLQNFSGFNMKKLTDLASLTVWNHQKQHGTAKNGKTVNETRPDRLRLKQDFQNCL